MKKSFCIISVLLAATAALAQTTNGPTEPRSIEIDGYAARVNNRVITRGEVRKTMAPILPELYRVYQGDKLEEELKKAFDNARNELVERALILEAFGTRGGQIPDQYVNDEIKRIIKDRFKGDNALFEQVLAEQKKTRDEYANELRDQMAAGMMVSEEISRRARITPEQVRAEYEANKQTYFIPEKVQYSVIVLNKGITDADLTVKKEEAARIRDRLLNGADFAETAKEVSEGSRAADGGAFPWMQPKDARPELQEILQALPVGKISQIIETENELYLVRIEGRRQAGYKSFDDVRAEIKTILTNKERKRLKKRWMARLKENAYILIYD